MKYLYATLAWLAVCLAFDALPHISNASWPCLIAGAIILARLLWLAAILAD